MVKVEKIHKDALSEKLVEDGYGLICFASFEDRCLTSPESVNPNKIKKACILLNTGSTATEKNKKNAEAIKNLFANAVVYEIDIENSLCVAETITQILQDFHDESIRNLLIDISTFTHEALLMAIRSVYEDRLFENIKLLYNGASSYSVGDEPNQVWLSKGCKEIRNVIGFAGVFNPSQKTHVIVLSGFEVERVTSLIEMLEPDEVSIGDGIDPTDENHNTTMNYFRSKFEVWKSTFQNAKTQIFKFSCCDIDKTMDLINGIISDNPSCNFILVPLNTKLSTLAVGLAALLNANVQVCYSIPEMYNSSAYSLPSENISIVYLSDCDIFKRRMGII